jgi:superoxide dismutase, Fe-Mn family
MTSTYQLPDLPYDYSALKPAVSPQLLELHHGKHHAAYVKGANEALDQLASAREADEYSEIGRLAKLLAFNVSGHVLHSLFWNCMSPNGGEPPSGPLQQAIESDFGSFDRLKKQMNASIAQLQGSGWAALAWEPVARRLIIEQVYDHQSNVGQGTDLVLVIDGWEHAYYLDYLNVRPDYVKAWWNVVNWENVAQRFQAAREKTSGLLLLS